jgi:hypothetical protein
MNRYRYVAKLVVCLLVVETMGITLLNGRAHFPSACAWYLCTALPVAQQEYRLLSPATLPDSHLTEIVTHDADRQRQKWELKYVDDRSIQLIVGSDTAHRWPGWHSYAYTVLASQVAINGKIALIREYPGTISKLSYLLWFDAKNQCIGYCVLYWRT